MLNTMLYDVEFQDGQTREYCANVISENMYAQVDTDDHSYNLLDGIVDFKKESIAIDKADKYIMTKSGQRRLRKSTKGWKLLVAWKDGSEQWVPQLVMKESNPLRLRSLRLLERLMMNQKFAGGSLTHYTNVIEL